MTWKRGLGVVTAGLAIAGCAVIAIGMANAAGPQHHRQHASTAPRQTPRPAYLPLTVEPTATRTASPRVAVRASPTPLPTSTTLHASAAPLAASHASSPPANIPTKSTASSVASRRTSRPAPVTRLRSRRAPTRAAHEVRGRRLPLRLRTHHARQVITVVARSRRSTVARLQAWRKLRNGRWERRGPRIRAHIGTAGMTWHASESKSATPMGSFTLTRAFGRRRNPGTALPYLHTNPADWWISQPGPLYNTHQRCRSHCRFIRGAPNEHLYYETPYYNYAVVIDYNTRNAPGGVRQGRGSAFFLHVTVGRPTAGCVAIRRARLVSIMRWLAPRKHPRILIGVG